MGVSSSIRFCGVFGTGTRHADADLIKLWSDPSFLATDTYTSDKTVAYQGTLHALFEDEDENDMPTPAPPSS
jgi:hypothetical protein